MLLCWIIHMLRSTCIDRKNLNAKLLKANIELWKWNNVLQWGTPVFALFSRILSPKMKGSSYSVEHFLLETIWKQLAALRWSLWICKKQKRTLIFKWPIQIQFNSFGKPNYDRFFCSAFQSCKSKGHLKSAMLCHKYGRAPLLYDFHSIELLFFIRIHFFVWLNISIKKNAVSSYLDQIVRKEQTHRPNRK